MKRAPLKRGQPLARGQPLKAGKPLKRGAKLKARKTPRAFRQRRDPQYCDWLRGQPCLLRDRPLPERELIKARAYIPSYGCYTHLCWPSAGIQVCHVKSRGAGGDDRGNVVPLCASAHEEQHRIGIKSFQARWDLDLKAAAADYWAAYQRETGAP